MQDDIGSDEPVLLLGTDPARFFGRGDRFLELRIGLVQRAVRDVRPLQLQVLTDQRPNPAVHLQLQVGVFEKSHVVLEFGHVRLELGHVRVELGHVGFQLRDVLSMRSNRAGMPRNSLVRSARSSRR